MIFSHEKNMKLIFKNLIKFCKCFKTFKRKTCINKTRIKNKREKDRQGSKLKAKCSNFRSSG